MNFWEAILFTLIFQIALLALNLWVFIFPNILESQNENLIFFLDLSPIFSSIIGFTFLWLFILRRNINFQNEKSQKINFFAVIAVVLMVFGLYFAERPFYDFYNNVILNQEFKPRNLDISELNNSMTITELTTGILFAPIFEEMFFRKFIFSKLLKKNSVINSILISSLCFALIHLPNYRQAISCFYAGILYAYIFYKTQNIIYPILLHFIGNLFYYILKFVGADFYVFMKSIKYNFTYWLIVMLGIGTLYLGIIIIEKLTKQNTTEI